MTKLKCCLFLLWGKECDNNYGIAVLIIKPTRCTSFLNLFLEWNTTCFGQFLCPSSGDFHCIHSSGTCICHTGLLTACEQDQDETAIPSWSCSQGSSILILLASCQQTYMTYTIVCTVKNSWWWTEELSETCMTYTIVCTVKNSWWWTEELSEICRVLFHE